MSYKSLKKVSYNNQIKIISKWQILKYKSIFEARINKITNNETQFQTK